MQSAFDSAQTSRPAGLNYLEVVASDPNIEREPLMNLHLTIGPLMSLIAGVLILVVPRLLNYIVAIYLIIIGLLGLFGGGAGGLHMN